MADLVLDALGPSPRRAAVPRPLLDTFDVFRLRLVAPRPPPSLAERARADLTAWSASTAHPAADPTNPGQRYMLQTAVIGPGCWDLARERSCDAREAARKSGRRHKRKRPRPDDRRRRGRLGCAEVWGGA